MSLYLFDTSSNAVLGGPGTTAYRSNLDFSFAMSCIAISDIGNTTAICSRSTISSTFSTKLSESEYGEGYTKDREQYFDAAASENLVSAPTITSSCCDPSARVTASADRSFPSVIRTRIRCHPGLFGGFYPRCLSIFVAPVSW